MDKQRRKELQEEYKKMKTYLGVIKLTNTVNRMIFLDGFSNLKNRQFAIEQQLRLGSHPNARLQKDFKEYGKEAFAYEVLEEIATDKVSDVKWEVKQMLKKWLNTLEPYGEKGYNKPPRD